MHFQQHMYSDLIYNISQFTSKNKQTMDFIKNGFILSLIFMFCCCYQQSHATDITNLLSNYPEFSSFSNYLTQTQLVNDINSRQSITILAVDNGGTGSLSGQGNDFVRTIMSIHVLLDYFDVAKLRSLAGGSTLTPTLFQTTGRAANQQGFVNMTITSGGAVLFTSGAQGSTGRASLVKTVVAQPYNVSVLQISGLIIPNGIQNGGSASTPPPPPPPPPPTASQGPPPPPPPMTTASPPSPATNTTSPPSPATNTTSPPSPATNTTSPPSPATNTTSPPSPANPPTASKSPAPSPLAGSPKTGPSPSLGSAPSPGPSADGPVAADKAGGSTVRFGGGLILTVVAISTWLTLG